MYKLVLTLIFMVSVCFIGCFGDDDDEKKKSNPSVNNSNNVEQLPDPMFDEAVSINFDAIQDPADMADDGTTAYDSIQKAGQYMDDLSQHPGCTPRSDSDYANAIGLVTENDVSQVPGRQLILTGYDCAAKEYTAAQDGTPLDEDTSKPIVVLIHGNSDTPYAWEEFLDPVNAGQRIENLYGFFVDVDATVRESLASKLIKAGYKTIAMDLRTDLAIQQTGTVIDDLYANDFNGYMNVDHGWATPLVQSLLKALMKENPSRKVAIIGHSLGVTVARDALRRNFIEYINDVDGAVNPYIQTTKMILLGGANHGVSTYNYCTYYSTMRGSVTCQMGDRNDYTPTDFNKALNGVDDAYATPCADGKTLFGGGVYGDKNEFCGNSAVKYYTITMEDPESGDLQDEFVSESSAGLFTSFNGIKYAENLTVTLDDYDSSAYFITSLPAFLANHYGAARSNKGTTLIMNKLAE